MQGKEETNVGIYDTAIANFWEDRKSGEARRATREAVELPRSYSRAPSTINFIPLLFRHYQFFRIF
jgi:hypothetical protein